MASTHHKVIEITSLVVPADFVAPRLDPPSQVVEVDPIPVYRPKKNHSSLRHLKRKWIGRGRIVVQIFRYWRHRKLEKLEIDQDKKCPACGARFGTITCVEGKLEIKHRCTRCSHEFFEPALSVQLGMPNRLWQ